MLFSDPIAGPAQTVAADLRDYPEWHRGRRRYGVWILPVVDPAVLGYLAAAREQLADLIHPCAQRQAHVTVYVCGFHGAGRRDDDFPRSALEHQVASLRARAGSACALPLAPLDSFASAAFVPVGDPGGRLAGWRKVLGESHSEIRPAAYVPHITLGLYRRRVPAQLIRQRLAAIAAPTFALRATELQYATYQAREHFGPLRCMRRVALSPVLETAVRTA